MTSLRTAVIGLLISFATIILIFRFTETSLTWHQISRADWRYFGIAIALQVAFWFLWAFRLMLLSSYVGCRIPFGYSVKISLASAFLAAITPSSAGGEPLRVKMIADSGANYGQATAAVVAERVLDAIFFAVALPFFIFLSGMQTSFGVKVAVIFILSLIAFLVLSYRMFRGEEDIKRISRIIFRILNRFKGEEPAKRWSTRIENELKMFRQAALDLLKNPPSRIAKLFISTALIWTSGFLIPSFILLSLHTEPHFLFSYTVQLIIIVLSLIPITPGGTGIAEAGAAYFYSVFVPSHLIGVLIGLWRITTYHLSLFVGFIVNIHILQNYRSK
jgi:hypothetical protein